MLIWPNLFLLQPDFRTWLRGSSATSCSGSSEGPFFATSGVAWQGAESAQPEIFYLASDDNYFKAFNRVQRRMSRKSGPFLHTIGKRESTSYQKGGTGPKVTPVRFWEVHLVLSCFRIGNSYSENYFSFHLVFLVLIWLPITSGFRLNRQKVFSSMKSDLSLK